MNTAEKIFAGLDARAAALEADGGEPDELEHGLRLAVEALAKCQDQGSMGVATDALDSILEAVLAL